MADEEQTDESQKTEDPTPKRLRDARERGQVALSREVNNFVMIFAGAMIILAAGPSVASKLKDIMQTFLARGHEISTNPNNLIDTLSGVTIEVGLVLFLPFLVFMIAGMIGPFIQTGPIFSAESMKPTLEKISPIKGLQRLFSLRSIAEFVKGVLKLVVLTIVGLIILMPFYQTIDHLVGQELALMLYDMHAMAFRLFVGVLAIVAIIAALDYMYQRHEHMKKMRMSTQEIKEEYKQLEGDPHIKARLKELRTQKAQQRMMQAVPEADVVITNPTHYAVALKYDTAEMDAPVMVAKGVDKVAERIREVANENDVPLVENPPLARALFDTMEIDEMIPEEQYKAVAEVISYVFKLKNKRV